MSLCFSQHPCLRELRRYHIAEKKRIRYTGKCEGSNFMLGAKGEGKGWWTEIPLGPSFLMTLINISE